MLNLIGINRDCNRTTLGVDRIFFISGARVESLNFDRLDRITSITTAEGESWLEAAFQPGDALFDQTQTRDGAWMKTTQRVTLNYSNVYSGILRAVRRLGDASRLHMIVLTIDGRAYYCGVNFWPERGYEWETTNFGVSGGNTTAGSPEAGAGMTIELEAVGRNYAPIIVANLADLPVADLPPADLDPDDTPPFVIDEFPADGITGVSITPGFFRLFFNEPVKHDGTAAQIQLVETGVGVVKTWTIGTSPGIQFDQAAQTITISQGIPTLSYSTAYHILFTSGVEDLSGNDWAGFSASTDWNFTTEAAPSTTVLAISSLSPADNSTTVDPSGVTSLQITYDSDAAPGAGNVVLWRDNGGGSYTIVGIYDVNGPNVAFAGDTVTVTIGSVLIGETDYFVQITPGAVVSDESGIAHAGITDTTTWNFTTIDTGPPSYVSFSPDVATENNSYSPASISFTASENLAKNSGNIVVKDWDDDSTIYTVAVTDASVSISGAIVTIDLSDMPAVDGSAAAILPPLKRVYIEMAAGTFQDTSGNNLPALAKATGDVWNFTTEKPPLFATLAPLTGSGAQTIGFETRNLNQDGVVVVEWEPNILTRYEVSSGSYSAQSHTFSAESSDNINVYLIGSDSAGSSHYEIDAIKFDTQDEIFGISLSPGAQIGTFEIIDCTQVVALSNVSECVFFDSLSLNGLPLWTGGNLDFVTDGGSIGTSVSFASCPGLSVSLQTVSGFPTQSFTFTGISSGDADVTGVTWKSSGTIYVEVSDCSMGVDGVVINRFVNGLYSSLADSSAGSAGGTLDFSNQQIDYTTGSGAGGAWASMWEIFNIPAAATDWVFSFDSSAGPLSVFETLDTSVVHTIESVGVGIGVMIGNSEDGIYSIHDYTTSGTARTTQTQTGMSGSAKNCWIAYYFSSGFDFSTDVNGSFESVHNSSTAVRMEIGCFPAGLIIQDLGDGSVLVSNTTLFSPASKARTATTTAGSFSSKVYSQQPLLTFWDRGGSFTDVDFSEAGTSLHSIRLASGGLDDVTIPQAIIDDLTRLEIIGSSVSFSKSFDLTSNTALQILNFTNVNSVSLSVNTASASYPSISALTLNNTTFSPMNISGFDQASQLNIDRFKSSGADHVIPTAMPKCQTITANNTTNGIGPISFELDDFPMLVNLFGNGKWISDFSITTPPHTKLSRFQVAPETTWSQSNTIDFSGVSTLTVVILSGTGSIGPLIPPGVGNGSNLISLQVPSLLSATDADALIDGIYDIRAESPSSSKGLSCKPSTGSIGTTQEEKILGVGAYAGDGLVDNGWTVTYS